MEAETATLQQPNRLGEEGPASSIVTEEKGPSQQLPLPPPPSADDDDDAAPALLSSSSSSDDEFEFEFPSVSRDSPAGTAAPADELFADGRIRCSPSCRTVAFGGGTAAAQPAAPARVVRGQLGRLFLEESRARSSSSVSVSSDDDDCFGAGLDPESYCLWTPGGSSSSSSSPRPPRKRSGSTGSVARWRRISDLIVAGSRSRSDGKDKFKFFLPAAPPPRAKEREAEAVVRKHQVKPSSTAATSGGVTRKKAAADAAHRDRVPAYVVAKGGDGGTPPRRTFLPYREELVGFFPNANGVSRSHHPFLAS